MAALTDLFARVRYPAVGTDLPVIMLMHGWNGTADIFTEAQLAGLTAQGVFVCVPGMRGRNGAGGSKDCSGKEVYDIYDALQQVRARYADRVSATKAAIVGFSGGGGSALAAACKFPDTWNLVVAHFGISDYGRDPTDGWHAQAAAGYVTDMNTQIGGTPAQVPDNYYARDATAAITNYTGAPLLLFHDEADSVVPVVHSQRIAAAMTAAELANCTAAYDVAYAHANYVAATEATWVPLAGSGAAWTIAASGTVTVIGYIVTKRFSVWLGDGLSEVATVAYGAVADQYTVTPLTGSVAVTITQGAKTVTQTITEATALVVV